MDKRGGDHINTVAAQYAARADAASPGQVDDAELADWLAADSRHLGAYMRALAVLARARRAGGAAASFDPDSYELSAGILRSEQEEDQTGRGWRHYSWHSAAAAALCLILVFFVFSDFFHSAQEYQTAVGEMRVIPLADGSTITLNTASKVTVRFSRRSRLVDLENGEVFFDVARDPERPFKVRAGHAGVSVIGTKFNLRRFQGGMVSLIVTDGIVDISRTAGNSSELRRVEAGTAIRVGIFDPMEEELISTDKLERAMAWRDGMLFFDGTSLKEAAQEFQRYNRAPVLVFDPSVMDRAVSGYFSARDPSGFAQAVADSMELELELELDYLPKAIFIKAADPKKAANLSKVANAYASFLEMKSISANAAHLFDVKRPGGGTLILEHLPS